ncbi:MAG: class I ribonucleotide reductase maintenance protein YfaE [Plesiomonas sp.]|uniref:class I ribonucleotide reductase maintenance protein YfaE n=1 Tax=Plesiomonas sp. TaxID=2486279 RepID=UPI003F38E29B
MRDPNSVCVSPTVIEYRGQQSLLETLEQAQYHPEFQCRSGFCGACRTRLLSGHVTYQQEPLAFIAADEILPCCCIPASDIEIER